jgi:hypothetical protein
MVGFLSLVSLLRHLRHWCAIEIRLMAQLLGRLLSYLQAQARQQKGNK